ncbi:MAG: IS630 family transposase [Myxococcota bacterium]
MPRRQAGPGPIELTSEEQAYLERVVRHPSTKNWDVLRAKIVLLWAEGLPPGEVAKKAGVSRQSVYNWVRRFRESRLAGLSDLPRSGRPRTVSDDDVAKVVELTLESSPRGATHWSTRGLAKKTGLSKSTVGRIWQAFRLQPHRSESFELSNDPLFVDKVRDVVGMYLDPPDRAVVFSVDEKTHIQALERTQTVLPMTPTRARGPTPMYARHGTVDLFAALDVGTGRVVGKTYPEHKSEQFIDFLRLLDESVDDELAIHLILDNHSIHRSRETNQWLARHPRFQLHFTPTYSSWLNQVEAIFSLLELRQLRQGVHTSVAELVQAIETFIEDHNDDPRPFKWVRTADEILHKVARFCGSVLDRHGPNYKTEVPELEEDMDKSS